VNPLITVHLVVLILVAATFVYGIGFQLSRRLIIQSRVFVMAWDVRTATVLWPVSLPFVAGIMLARMLVGEDEEDT
jgi:hypothetical protein